MVTILNTNTDESVSFLPETGGMLYQIKLLINNKLTSILDTYPSEQVLAETLSSSFKGSFLYPFPNRIDAGKYSFNNKDYKLDINFPDENNAIHGLVFDKKFDTNTETVNENEASVLISYKTDGSLKGYPFLSEVQIQFTLSAEKGLIIESTAKNTDLVKIPVGFGWHPYFTLNEPINKLKLSFPSEDKFEVNHRMLPTKTTKFSGFVEMRQIEDYAFDTCFSFADTGEIAETKLYSDQLNGGISIWQQTGKHGCNYVQIYIPPHRNSIAVEPMTCIANTFNNKIGMIELAPGKSTKNIWGVAKL